MAAAKKQVLAAAIGALLTSGSADAVVFYTQTFDSTGSVGTGVPGDYGVKHDPGIYPGTIDATQTIYHWGMNGNASNSRRTITYDGVSQDPGLPPGTRVNYSLTSLTLSGTVRGNTELPGGSFTSFIQQRWLWLELTLNGQTQDTSMKPGVTTTIGTGTVFTSDPLTYDFISSRNISGGTDLDLEFSLNPEIWPSGPDARYSSSAVTVALDGSALVPIMTTGTSNFAAARAGTGPISATVATVGSSAAGAAGSRLDGTVSISGAQFSGGPGTFTNLSRGDTQNYDFTFTPLASIGSNAAGVVSSGTVTFDADYADLDGVPGGAAGPVSTPVGLTGTTVGPIFDISGYGNGGIIDLGSIDISAGPLIQTLTLQNLFGTDLGDLTDLTILDVVGPLGGSGYFSLSGLPGTPFELDAIGGGTNTQGFNVSFDPSSTGTFQSSLTFLTDVGAAKGVSGSSYTFYLQGTGTSGGGPTPTPAPTTLALLGLGLGGLAGYKRRKKA